MAAYRLLAKLAIYYSVLIVLCAAGLWLFPALKDYLPVGRVETLIAQAGGALDTGQGGIKIAHVDSLAGSLVWLVSAIVGALATSLPVSWVYMEIREPEHCDQSLIDTIVVLPMVVTGIVVIVQHSLALSFSLAGIAGLSRFRNSLKSTGDLLFILLAVGIGFAAGIGALELALVTSMAFNLCFFALWSTRYGARRMHKRYLNEQHPATAGVATASAAALSPAADSLAGAASVPAPKFVGPAAGPSELRNR